MNNESGGSGSISMNNESVGSGNVNIESEGSGSIENKSQGDSDRDVGSSVDEDGIAWWLWLLIVIILLCYCCCIFFFFFCYRKRREPKRRRGSHSGRSNLAFTLADQEGQCSFLGRPCSRWCTRHLLQDESA